VGIETCRRKHRGREGERIPPPGRAGERGEGASGKKGGEGSKIKTSVIGEEKREIN